MQAKFFCSPDTQFDPIGKISRINYLDNFNIFKRALIEMQERSHIKDSFAWFNQEVLGQTASSMVPAQISTASARPRDNGLAAFCQRFEDDESTDGEGGNNSQVGYQAPAIPVPALVDVVPASLAEPVDVVQTIFIPPADTQELQTADVPVEGPSSQSTGSISANGPENPGGAPAGRKGRKKAAAKITMHGYPSRSTRTRAASGNA